MKKLRVGINGMGRIGKNIARVIVETFNDSIEIVAGNDLVSASDIAKTFERDSIYGKFPVPTTVEAENRLQLGQHHVTIYSEKDATNIPWRHHDVDVVFECSRFYLSQEKSQAHLDAGAKKVIISAPCKDQTKVIVVGVNHNTLTGEDTIISNASCTTNCYAPMTLAIDKSIPILSGLMSTTHAATSEQKIADTFGNAKSRSLLNNILLVSTGAAIAVGKVLPHLNGRLNATGLRVPVNTGSVVEAIYLLEGNHTANDITHVLEQNIPAINESTLLKQVIYFGDKYECSADCIGSPYSSMITKNILTIPCNGNTLTKLTSFYDNEMGFSYRMAELALIMNRR
jgi:glyceraldehyde 3-phosphate dehydrogenase